MIGRRRASVKGPSGGLSTRGRTMRRGEADLERRHLRRRRYVGAYGGRLRLALRRFGAEPEDRFDDEPGGKTERKDQLDHGRPPARHEADRSGIAARTGGRQEP